MIRTLVSVSLVWLVLAPAAVPAPIPEDALPFTFPTTPGTKWVYRYSTPPREEMVVYLADAASDAEKGKTITMRYKDVDGEDAIWEQMTLSDRGLFVHQEGPFKHVPPTCWLRHPYQHPAEWPVQPTLTSVSSEFALYGAMKQGPVERVSVPAGTFEAVRVQVKGDGFGQWGETHWYATRVGIVKRIDRRGDTIVLVSFTPGRAK